MAYCMSMKLDDLTKAQRDVLEAAAARKQPVQHSGRGGWNDSVMRALARKGLAQHERDSTWERWYRLTPEAMGLGAEAHAARVGRP